MKKYVLLIATIAFVNVASSQPLTSPQIDSVTNLVLKTFDVPGIAVAVVKDNKVIHAKGYGVRSLSSMQPVDENTLFGIASNSKAFTTTAISMLVDEGKLRWDDKVIDYIPEFRMYNPYVTDEFTIRDLVTHRSGLGLGAGDLMFFPDSSDFTKADMIHNLRYLKPASAFRTKYDYDNNLYMVAGEVLERVSKMSWEEFIQKRILDPLKMNMTAPSFKLLKNKSNVVDPHAPVDGKVKAIRRDWNQAVNAAGGIYSNVSEMTKWVITQLNNGKSPDGKQLWSTTMQDEMWSPQTIIQVKGQQPYNTHFAAYGLGWFLSDVKGYKQATHTGGLAGIVTQVTLIPELNLGIIVFTNQQSGAAFSAITNSIKDGYLGVPVRKWVDTYRTRVKAAEANEKQILDRVTKEIDSAINVSSGKNLALYTGTYHDQWFGDVVISLEKDKLKFKSKRSYLLQGDMFPFKGNTFVVKWYDRSMNADAFVMFSLDKDAKPAGMKMEAISPLTDFSFDFQDLDFKRKE